MKKVLLLFLSSYFFISDFIVNAQSIANYSTSRNTSILYNSISSTGNAISSWRYSGSFGQDDNRSNFIDIGFDFWYNGVRYTQFCVSTNGFLDFSSSTDDGGPQADDFGYDNSAFTNATAGLETRPAIAPFYDDLTAQGGVAALGDALKYEVTGSAPNRVLTVEWINMAVYLNTTPDLDFQVKLYENTGVIEVLYDTMETGSHTFSYTLGINAPTMSNPPTAAQLKTLQTANTNTFSQTVQNNLITLPDNQSMYTFTPPLPNNPSGSLTFTAVTSTSMTLNWTNFGGANHRGYVIYNSTDNINFNYVTQTVVNATSSNITALLPGTTYYWKLYAVSEGALSNSLDASQATNPPVNKISSGSGNWNTAGTWTPSGVPTAADNVTIANGHTVSINATGVCNSLTIGQGASGVLQYTGGAARTLTVNSDITINNGGSFIVNTGSNVTHALIVKGNITNNGSINLATDANSLCNVTVSGTSQQNLSGTGITNNFNRITINNGTNKNNIFDISTPTFSAAANFLTLTNGTFKLSSTGTISVTPYTGTATLTNTNRIWLNAPNTTMQMGAGVNLYGDIILENGTLNIGDAANEDLVSYGGSLSISGGNLNVAGKYYSPDINNLVNIEMSGGTFTLPKVGSTNTVIAPFEITSAGSNFTLSGGTIVIEREGGGGTQNLGFVNTGGSVGSVTGGVLQIGNVSTPASQQFNINSSYNLPALQISSNNATANITSQDIQCIGGVSIEQGILTSNNFNISLTGNWLNNATFNQGTGTVLLNGNTPQIIGGTTIHDFYNLQINNTSGVTLNSSQQLINELTISNGTFNMNSQTFTLLSNSTSTARISEITGTGAISGNVTAQRFVPGGSTGWIFIGTPISSGLTFNDLDDDMYISCLTCPDESAGGFVSIYSYDETVTGGYDEMASFVPISGINDPITHTKGYWMYFGTDETTTTDVTLDVSGPVGQGNINIPLTYTSTGNSNDDGWNLISNPYPSAISWNALKGATSNIDDAIYVWNADLNGGVGGYASYVNGISSPAVSSGGIDDNIAMFQGFYVHSTGATSLSAQESNKVSANPTYLKTEANKELLRLQLEGLNYKDEALLYLSSESSYGFDPMLDAYKLPSNAASDPSISWVHDNQKIHINAIPFENGEAGIPIHINSGIAGDFRLKLIENTLPEGICIQVYDQVTGINHNLKNSSYEFNISVSPGENRFTLFLTKEELPTNYTLLQPSCTENNLGKMIAKPNGSGPFTYIWKNALGQEIKKTENKFDADTLENIPFGSYSVQINQFNFCSEDIKTFVVENTPTAVASFNIPDTIFKEDAGILIPENNSINANEYTWFFGDGNISNSPSPSHIYLSSGTYEVILIAQNNGCPDTTRKVVQVYLEALNTQDYQNKEDIISFKIIQGELWVHYPNEFKGESNVEIYGISGNLVYQSKMNILEKSAHPIHYLQSGTYVLSVKAMNSQFNERFIWVR